QNQIEEIRCLFERIGAVRDHDPIGLILIEDRVDLSHQINPVGIAPRLAREATEGNLLNSGNAVEVRKLVEELAVAKPFVRFNIPRQIQAIGANGIDGPALQDQSNSRQGAHCEETLVLIEGGVLTSSSH